MLSIVSSPSGDVTVLLTNSFKPVSRYNVAFSRKLTLFTWFVRFHFLPAAFEFLLQLSAIQRNRTSF